MLNKNILQNVTAKFIDIKKNLDCYLGKESRESVYFYTFHKCASTLFSRYVLQNMDGLRHINYANQVYTGRNLKKIEFKSHGYVYGPIRLSAYRDSQVYKVLIEPTTREEFIRDKLAIFCIRDPRDILVSSYFSMGFTHGLSPVKEIKDRQETLRKEIQAKTLDEYVLVSADKVVEDFQLLERLIGMCQRNVLVKYEDMINDFNHFIDQFTSFISIRQDVVQEIYSRSRPKAKEDPTSPRRSGQTGGFRSKLKEETIASLNMKLEHPLKYFNYSI